MKSKKDFIKRIVDKGGNFVAHRVMLRPNIDISRGQRADNERESILRRRESVRKDKEIYGSFDEKGNYTR